jgi:hypothetical protein
MARGKSIFKQRDAAALMRAAKLAGLEVQRVEVGSDGKIIVVTSAGKHPAADTPDDNEWDRTTR